MATRTAHEFPAFPFSFMGLVEMTLGAGRGSDASHTVFESQTRYRLADEVGYGLSERSVVHQEVK
jgi:hypothetical protein